MPLTQGDVQIYYETRGSSGGVPILFTQGFTAQFIHWREEFFQLFVDAGAFVILYDNRDVGLSQKFGGPEDYDGGYDLADMAADGLSVLDSLGLASAHVVGASMGGMISQIMALSQPSRVRSLNLIYTAPSFDMGYFPSDGVQSPEDMARRLDRAGEIESAVAKERGSASTAYPFDEDWARELGGRSFDRCYAPEGRIRQAYAVSRWAPVPADLGRLAMPCSIIHGRADRRIKAEAALDIARILDRSEVHIFEGMGHEVPQALWGEIVTIIMRTAARAGDKPS
jgi:pimeloyl-ACP methyl ester carboxylesterase